MSSPSPKSKAPVASRRKRALHALYLAQPFLQFVALMAVLFVLNRCSPLAPSTDKGSKMLSASSLGANHSPQEVQSAEDADLEASLVPVQGESSLTVMSQSDYEDQIEPNAVNAASGGELADVQRVFRQRKHGGAHVMVLPLSKEQRDAFFAGKVRVDLAAALAPHMSLETRRAYFTALQQIQDLNAKVVLVMPDGEPVVGALPISPKVQLGLFADSGKGRIVASRSEQGLDDQQQKLIASYKDKAVSMALVLE